MGDQVEGSKNKIEFSFFSYFLEQKTIFFSEHLPHICAAIHSLRHEKKILKMNSQAIIIITF